MQFVFLATVYPIMVDSLMVKRITESTAIVIYNDNHEKVLTVRRPLDDTALPGYWGFPAATRKMPTESWEDLAHKAAKIKLGVDIEVVRFMGEDTIDRGEYILKLRDYECRIISGIPSVPQSDNSVTQYVAMNYSDDYSLLQESAKNGSLCTRIFLKEKGIWEK